MIHSIWAIMDVVFSIKGILFNFETFVVLQRDEGLSCLSIEHRDNACYMHKTFSYSTRSRFVVLPHMDPNKIVYDYLGDSTTLETNRPENVMTFMKRRQF